MQGGKRQHSDPQERRDLPSNRSWPFSVRTRIDHTAVGLKGHIFRRRSKARTPGHQSHAFLSIGRAGENLSVASVRQVTGPRAIPRCRRSRPGLSRSRSRAPGWRSDSRVAGRTLLIPSLRGRGQRFGCLLAPRRCRSRRCWCWRLCHLYYRVDGDGFICRCAGSGRQTLRRRRT